MLAICLFVILYGIYGNIRLKRQLRFIEQYQFPPYLFDRLQEHHPQLSAADCEFVAQGLRQYFLAYHHSDFQFVAMPSQVVDDLWHEFILHTRGYADFCERAFGDFMHHTPAVALNTSANMDEALQLCWVHACELEGLSPLDTEKLPLLFELDHQLNIERGFKYSLDTTEHIAGSNLFSTRSLRRARRRKDSGGSCGGGGTCSGDGDSSCGDGGGGCGGG